MGRIVAIGGGGLGEIAPIHQYAINLAGVEKVKILFIPTASKDNDRYIVAFKNAFSEYNCDIKTLLLVKEQCDDSEIDELFDWADLIYIGGGNVIYMMSVWRKLGIDQKIKEVFSTDRAVIVGQGSGGLSLFQCGYSNSVYSEGKTDWQMIWSDDLLDLHHVAACPHYSGNDMKNFDKRLLEKEVPGIGLADRTAFVQIEQHTEYVSCTEDDKAFYLIYLNGELVKKEINMKCLKGTD